jgi:carboxypeptidase Q
MLRNPILSGRVCPTAVGKAGPGASAWGRAGLSRLVARLHTSAALFVLSVGFAGYVVAGAMLVVLASPVDAQSERLDRPVLGRIRDEGFQHSHVMEIASWMTDVFGPRLTGSSNAKRAGTWAIEELKSWGISTARFEYWQGFGAGWEDAGTTARVVAPDSYSILAYPTPWTFGTNGLARGAVAIVVIETESDLARYHGTLRGKWVLVQKPIDIAPTQNADACRFDEAHLAAMERTGVALQCDRPVAAQLARDSALRARSALSSPQPRSLTGANSPRVSSGRVSPMQLYQFFSDEGVLGIMGPGIGRDGTVQVGGGAGPHLTIPPRRPAALNVVPEHYGRIYRTVEKGIPVTFEATVDNRFLSDSGSFNVIGEIPGSDPKLAGDVVMLGAHLDSWTAGTGATDNAAGVAVMLEAMRILKSLDLPMRRTVRIALWTGEEQGLLGSHAYVRQHFGFVDSTGAHWTTEWEKLSAYFNLDNGSGAIRGIYAERNEAAASIFKQWLSPFADLGATTVTLAEAGGTDHMAFEQVGLPGFQFIQDPLDYWTRTHHTNMDLFERLAPRDLMQNAVIVASFAYHAAMRNERLPRRPAPLRR